MRFIPCVQGSFIIYKSINVHCEIIRMIMQMHSSPHIVKSFLCVVRIYFCFIDYAKAFDCVDHNKLWKILQEMGVPDHQTCH